MEASGGFDANLTLSCNGSMQPSSTYKETDNLGDDLLVDLDSYLEELTDRLSISRMVSDSVIKGMVNAVTEEAAERIAQKESEITLLKERLHFYESGLYKAAELEFPSFSPDLVRQGSMEECLGNLVMVSEKQFHVLERRIEDIKVCKLLPGQSNMKESEKWAVVDQTLNTLRTVLNTVCIEVDNLVRSSPYEWQREREFQDEVEAMVIRNSIRSLQEEYEVQLWEQRAKLCSSQSTDQLAKINQLSSLRQELNSISRTLSSPEMGHLPLNGPQEGSDESNNGKRKDHFHQIFSNHNQANSHSESNGKTEESKTAMTETLDFTQLKPMKNDELITLFNREMTKMKRNHESHVQEITEEYFSLRREFLRERGPSSSLKRDKDFEAFRKRIPELIVKLDNMLAKNEKIPAVNENNKIICSLKDRIDTLLSENRQLKDMLTNKSKDVKCLSSQVSNAAEKMSNHSLAEANLLKQIRKLKCDIEDTWIKAAIEEDVCTCILKELFGKIKWAIQDSDMESRAILEIYEILFREFTMNAKARIKCDIVDSDMKSILMQEISGIIFREAAKDAEGTINHMKMKYEEEKGRRVSLEACVLQSEKALSLEIEEKELLKQDIVRFSTLMKEKEKLALEKGSLLMKEKERRDQIDQELNWLRNQASQKEILVTESRKESNTLKSKLEEALGQMQLCEKEKTKLDRKLILTLEDLKVAEEAIKTLHGIIQEKETALKSKLEEALGQMQLCEKGKTKLDQKLILALEDLKVAEEAIKTLHGIIQEKETALSLVEAKEIGQKRQFESITSPVQILFKAASEFEGRTMEAVEKSNLRLKRLKLQLDPLIQNATSYRRMELVHKQKLEKRYSDLQKAEAEVDLLGDEVEALLSLLEKIYIALYHYSPVLQHYPGIMETLKLIKRELSVETTYDQQKKC